MSPLLGSSTIKAGEEGILARLRAKVLGVAIEGFPDNPETYRLLHQQGALLVAFRGAQYSEPEDSGEVVQARRLLYDVHVLARRLSDHVGAYDLLEAARLALAGHRIRGFTTGISPRAERFLSQKDGVWTYALTVAIGTIASEADEETIDTLLQHLTLESDYTTSEISNG